MQTIKVILINIKLTHEDEADEGRYWRKTWRIKRTYSSTN